jgi:hypothetical protein
MLRTKILAPAALLLVASAVGSALTRHSRGAANVLSNIFFFTLAILLLFFVAVGVTASVRALRNRKTQAERTA